MTTEKTGRKWKKGKTSVPCLGFEGTVENMKVMIIRIVVGTLDTVGQNTEKGPGDLRRLALPQTPLKDHQLTLMWKTLKE